MSSEVVPAKVPVHAPGCAVTSMNVFPSAKLKTTEAGAPVGANVPVAACGVDATVTDDWATMRTTATSGVSRCDLMPICMATIIPLPRKTARAYTGGLARIAEEPHRIGWRDMDRFTQNDPERQANIAFALIFLGIIAVGALTIWLFYGAS